MRAQTRQGLLMSKNRQAPDWDQHFNRKTTFGNGKSEVQLNPAFNPVYENEMIDKIDLLNDNAIEKYL